MNTQCEFFKVNNEGVGIRCIYVQGHGGDHFVPDDRLDHSDEIRIRILKDIIIAKDDRIAELENSILACPHCHVIKSNL